MTEITYRQDGDYLIPNISLPEQTDTTPLGRYGRMRKQYLKEHRPVLWSRMVLNGTLWNHLRQIDQTANERLDKMIPELVAAAGATEALKASDPMTWTGLMNSCKVQAEETILAELIYN